jgi:GDP-L-fucose synthase
MNRILVLGSNGLVGNSLKEILGPNHVYHTKNDSNLLSSEVTKNYLEYQVKNKGVDTIINCAAKVGGVLYNQKNNENFFLENFKINSNVISTCLELQIKNFVNLSSTCVFPDDVPIYPLTPDQMLVGQPHHTNFGYAFSKRISTYQTSIINKVLKYNWITVVPTNIYGPNDNFNLENGHVIPSLIHKAFLSKKNNTKFVIWGDGEAERQFIYSMDLAKNILWAIDNWNKDEPFMSVNPKEYKIKKIVDIISEKFNIKSEEIEYDFDKPKGQEKKPAISNIQSGYNFIGIKEGLSETIDWFVKNYDFVRK